MGLKSACRLLISIGLVAVLSVLGYASAALAATTATPTALKEAAYTASTIDLTWTAVKNAPRYRIQMATTSSMSDALYFQVTPNFRQMTELKANTKYYFRVRVITADGDNLSPYTSAVSANTAAAPALKATPKPLRIGSFNIRCANCHSDSPDEGTWVERRSTVASTIVGQSPDAIGVQEAAQSWLKDSSGKSIEISQFEDLRNRLKTAGGNYKLANANRNNCVKSTTPTNCVYKDQGASKGTKVLYNANTVELVAQGSKKLTRACGDCSERYVAWAILRQKSTAKKFFFATTHVEPTAAFYTQRSIQTRQAVAEIKAKNTGRLPVIVTGDFNTTRYYSPANDPYDQMIASGLVDPLGHTYKSATISGKATAENRIHANYSSSNGFIRKQVFYKANENGNNIDYIFTSPMRITGWETVVKVDAAGLLTGRIPSDHNMIRATALLP